MNRISEFEVIDHGIDHAQYFQGCGVSFTKFEHVVTGCGQDAKEAIDDALDSMAQNGVDVSAVELGDYYLEITRRNENNSLLTVTKYVESHGGEMAEDCELYYYVSIRYSLS